MRAFNFRSKESGFTLVELLVVIIIIGILAAIAIPVFLNQRQRANDAAVLSALKSYGQAIESLAVSSPNDLVSLNTQAARDAIKAEGAVKSDGVVIKLWNTSKLGDRVVLCGYHVNGKEYTGDGTAANPGAWAAYDNLNGGLRSDPVDTAGLTCSGYAVMP